MRRAAGGGAPAALATFKAFPIQARSSSITVNPTLSAGMLGCPSAPKALPTNGIRVGVRIGLASGPVVAGVVGSRRFFYDVWGDAVNVASRMETTDSVGRIQVPEDVYQRLKNDFLHGG